MRGRSAYTVFDEYNYRRELLHRGPFQAFMNLYSDFFAYKSGIYVVSPNATFVGGHSVRVVGWGVGTAAEGSLPYWLCANSWNADWGDGGYFRIRRGSNEADIETRGYAGIPSI